MGPAAVPDDDPPLPTPHPPPSHAVTDRLAVQAAAREKQLERMGLMLPVAMKEKKKRKKVTDDIRFIQPDRVRVSRM